MIICGLPLSRFFALFNARRNAVMSWPSTFLDVKAVGLKALAGILALGRRRHRVERDRVRVVNQDQVIESEMAGERARFRRDAFLQATIAGETDDVLIENHVLRRVESRGGHLRRHGHADGVRHPLAERAGGAFHAGRFEELRVARRLAVQLAEALDLLHRKVVAAQVQPGVKKHAAVAGREDEVIAADPARLVRVVLEGVAVKHRARSPRSRAADRGGRISRPAPRPWRGRALRSRRAKEFRDSNSCERV